jgi:cytochrome c biogenesis protein CcmG, thiol:disulfide interchange protein DsbE
LPPTPSSPGAEPRRRRGATAALVAGIVVVVGALLFVSLRSSQHSPRSTNRAPRGATIAGRAVVGKAAPVFTATDLEGHPFSLASYRGRALIVSFGASWCHPCRQEYPLLVAAAAKYSKQLAVVSVMHDDLSGDARAFVKKFHAEWPAINDESNAISASYGVVGVPQTFFITPQGVVQARVYGITSHAALDGPLNRLLSTR